MFMKREIGLERVSMVIKLTQDGDFRSEIAEKTKMSQSSVYKWQKKFHLLG